MSPATDFALLQFFAAINTGYAAYLFATKRPKWGAFTLGAAAWGWFKVFQGIGQ